MEVEDLRSFNDREQETWRRLYQNLEECRRSQADPMFVEGLKALGMVEDHTPDLDEVNRRLFEISGWKGVAVKGLEGGDEFYPALAKREFPIGNFIRNLDDLNYTPEPDIFHDLYGHIPLFVDKEYAQFCEEYGKRSVKYMGNEDKFHQWERFFWFTIEFGLVETPQGRRIFGGGILSSLGESSYSLSDEPEVLPFDIDAIRNQEFRIDQMQKRIFVMKSKEQLYNCLDELEDRIVNGPSEPIPIVN